MTKLQTIFEVNGNDRLVLTYEALRTEANLLTIAQELAKAEEMNLSDITIRFAALPKATR